MKAGVRLDSNTGQYFPQIDGKDISPSSFDEKRARDIATQAVNDAPLVALRPGPRLIDNYVTEYGWRMEREESGLTPDGIPIDGRWVLRDHQGTFVDWGPDRHVLAKRNHMRIIYDLMKALQDIIYECPDPKKLPYPIRVNEIAREAIEQAKKSVNALKKVNYAHMVSMDIRSTRILNADEGGSVG